MKSRLFMVTALCALIGWNASASADNVLVSAASSLTNAFTELTIEFQRQHPGTKVLMSFAGSDVLAQQIIQGAPSDVFASADQQAMDKAVKAKVINPASRKNFARNEVVLVVPFNNPLNIKSLADLGGSGVKRVAFGNPAIVPAGRYTKAALEHSGNWSVVKQREVLGQNVRQVLDYLARGEVDAGFVFSTDALIMADKVKVVESISSPVPVLYPIALVQRANRHPLAAEFLTYVLSPEGQSVLAKYGFAKP